MSETGTSRTHAPAFDAKEVVADYNRYIDPYRSRHANQTAGAGQIFERSARELIVWQTRPAIPSEYEMTLASALEQIFAQHIHELPDLVEALNREGVRTPDGQVWTEQNFQSTLRELGQLAFG